MVLFLPQKQQTWTPSATITPGVTSGPVLGTTFLSVATQTRRPLFFLLMYFNYFIACLFTYLLLLLFIYFLNLLPFSPFSFASAAVHVS